MTHSDARPSADDPLGPSMAAGAPVVLGPPKVWVLVLWPSFLAACALSMLVFSLVNPADLHVGERAWGLSATTTYSLAFFCFWAATGAAAAVTAWLMRPPQEVNPTVL